MYSHHLRRLLHNYGDNNVYVRTKWGDRGFVSDITTVYTASGSPRFTTVTLNNETVAVAYIRQALGVVEPPA